MRWLILALSLGTTLAALQHGIMLFITILGTARTASSIPFWWAAILCVGSLFGFIGGVLAFNHKTASLLFLLTASVMAFLGHQGKVLGSAFMVISVLTFTYLNIRRSKLRAEGYEYEEVDEEDEDDTEENEDADTDEDDEEYDDGKEQMAPIPAKYKIPRRRSSYLVPDEADSFTIKPPQRQRETKVCLSCGMDVPISYKYCPSCGAELYTPPHVISVNNAESILVEEDKEIKYETLINGAEANT